MVDKVKNYTDEMVARLHEVYDPKASEDERADQVQELAVELGKSAASIRAKLGSEGVYVAKAKAPAGKNTVRKAELVEDIAEKLDMDLDAAGSLEKVTKAVLQRLVSALTVE